MFFHQGQPRRIATWFRRACFGCGIFISFPTQAAEPAPIMTTMMNEWQLESKLRQQLFRDPELRQCNIGLSIRGATANLWGNVEKEETSQLAERLVRANPAIREVRNQIVVRQSRQLHHELADMVKELDQNPRLVQSIENDRMLAQATPKKAVVPVEMVVNRQPVDERSPLDKYLEVLGKDARFRSVQFNLQDRVMRIEGQLDDPGLASQLASQFNRFPEIRQTLVLVKRK
jgi:hypothetical protein